MKRFEQVKRLYNTMSVEYTQHSDSYAYIAGITSDFDRLFELCWKTLKEYLQKEEYVRDANTGSPKRILKLAYQQKLINDEEGWLKMLADRNDDTHHYNESSARSYVARIEREYLGRVHRLIDGLSELIPEEKDILVNVPSSFLEAVHQSGMYYDEFLEKVKRENECLSDLDLFMKWDTIKNKYLINTMNLF